MDLPVLWALIIGFALTMYAILDGFDIGVGILMLGRSNAKRRDEMINSVYPIWDGNETWIVLVGVGLFGGFPEAYSILLPAFYLPLIVMLLSIIARGVSLEFRFSARNNPKVWDTCFSVASVLIAFTQGLVLGHFLEGIPIQAGQFAGTPWGFVSSFSVAVGLLVVGVYARHGTYWLIVKADQELERRMRHTARWLTPATGAWTAGCVLLFVLFVQAGFTSTHLTGPLKFVLFTGLVGTWLTGWFTQARSLYAPFVSSIFLVAIGATIVYLYVWPYIIPPSLTLADAASEESSQRVLLYGALAVIPIILSYTTYGYYVFRGKSTAHYDTKRTQAEQHYLENEQADRPSIERRSPFSVPTWGKVVVFIGWFIGFFVMVGMFGTSIATILLVGVLLTFIFSWAWHSRTN